MSAVEIRPKQNRGQHPRLWIVDDHEAFRSTCAEALGTFGLPCERQFDSAEVLIEVLQQAPGPDLLLLDNGLPGLSGADAVKSVKSLSPATCVFVMSSLASYREQAEALSGGARGFFEKSDPLESMVNAMRVALSLRKTPSGVAGRLEHRSQD